MVKVYSYGDVNPKFKALVTEIFQNVSYEMKGFPNNCRLNLCRSMTDTRRVKCSKVKEFLKWFSMENARVATDIKPFEVLRFDIPEVIITEDFAKATNDYMEEFEGRLAHEVGHVFDYTVNNKFTIPTGNLLKDYASYITNECEAENNAIEAGYYSGIFARDFRTFNNFKGELRATPRMLKTLMSTIGIYSTFVNSSVPPKGQKDVLAKAWSRFSNKKNKLVRELLNNKELMNVDTFYNEKELEDFVVKKQQEWGVDLEATELH